MGSGDPSLSCRCRNMKLQYHRLKEKLHVPDYVMEEERSYIFSKYFVRQHNIHPKSLYHVSISNNLIPIAIVIVIVYQLPTHDTFPFFPIIPLSVSHSCLFLLHSSVSLLLFSLFSFFLQTLFTLLLTFFLHIYPS